MGQEKKGKAQFRALLSYKKRAAKIAAQLGYGNETVNAIDAARSEIEVDNALTGGRHRMKDLKGKRKKK